MRKGTKAALALGLLFGAGSAVLLVNGPLGAAHRSAAGSAGRSVVPAEPEGPPPVLGPAPAFELTGADGRRVRSSELSGPWIANFIFTRCGSQCPMLTSRMRALSSRLPGVRLVTFSVDPQDGPASLAGFAKAHRADWLFLTGGEGEVSRLCREGFKLSSVDDRPDLHSRYFVLVDGAGAIRGYFDGTDESALDRLAAAAGDLGRT